MNFLSVGFVLCALNFNMGWELDYGVRLVGALFVLSGLAEADTASDGFKRFKPHCLALLVISAGGLAATLLLRFGALPKAAENPLGLVFGLAAAGITIYAEYLILGHMLMRHELVNDPALLGSLEKVWKRYAFFAALSVAAEALYRILPDSGFQAGVGAVEVISRIIMYVYVVLVGTAFARVRQDFNIMHPV